MEAIMLHQDATRGEAREGAIQMLEEVGIGNAAGFVESYPHQFSEGMRQRAIIAMALSCNPSLLIADEPTTALDVTTEAQILELMRDLEAELGLTYLFIAHDLSVIGHISDRVAAMYVGKLVEVAETEELFMNPKHPYTEALMSAVPKPDPRARSKRIVLAGEVADPSNPPSGCYFHPRCMYAQEVCQVQEPQLEAISSGHYVSCHRAAELTLAGVLS